MRRALVGQDGHVTVMVFEFETEAKRNLTAREVRRQGYDCLAGARQAGDATSRLEVREESEEGRAAVEALVRRLTPEVTRSR